MSVVFLMLVHQDIDNAELLAVSEPEVWEAYLAKQPLVRLYAHCDGKQDLEWYRAQPFLQQRCLPNQITCMWDHESLVEAAISGMEQVLHLHPGLQHIIMCSGTDVPIMLVGTVQQEWLRSGESTYLPFDHPIREQAMWFHVLERACKHSKAVQDVAGHGLVHSQWMAVWREHAKALVAHRKDIAGPDTAFARVHMLLKEVAPQGGAPSPDEWCMGTAIQLYARRAAALVKQSVCMAVFADSQHPVMFTSMRKRVKFQAFYTAKEACSNLVVVLNHAASVKCITVRKVRMSSAAQKAKLLDYLQNMWGGRAGCAVGREK